MDRFAPMRLPAWLRILTVAGAFILVAGAGLFAYRWYSRPTTLTIAVGSLDGEATRLISALASRLAAVNARVRLNLVETTSALEAADLFSSSKTDLAVVRGDVGDLSQAQAVVILAHAVVLLVAPPGSSIADIAGLKRTTVGVVGGEMNRRRRQRSDRGVRSWPCQCDVPQSRAGGNAACARIQGSALSPDRRSRWPRNTSRCCAVSFCRTQRPRRSLFPSKRPVPLPRSSAPTKASMSRRARCGARLRFRATT